MFIYIDIASLSWRVVDFKLPIRLYNSFEMLGREGYSIGLYIHLRTVCVISVSLSFRYETSHYTQASSALLNVV